MKAPANRRPFLLTGAVGLALVLASAADAQDASPPASLLNLDGAVHIEGDLDAADFAPYDAFLHSLRAPLIVVTVTPQGQLLSCESAGGDIPAGLAEPGCLAMVDQATITVWRGYQTGGREGIFGVNFFALSAPTHQAQMPVHFTHEDANPEIELVVGEEALAQCTGFGVAGEVHLSSASFDAACEALLALSEEKRAEACLRQSEIRGRRAWRCRIVAEEAGQLVPVIHMRATSAPGLPAPVYDAPRPWELPLVFDGRRVVANVEYPIMAYREHMQGDVQLLLGFDDDGRMRTCRPISTSGHAYLDNDACVQIVHGGRVDASPASLTGRALHFTTVTISMQWPADEPVAP